MSSSVGERTGAANGALIGDVGTAPGERGGGHVGCAGEMGSAAAVSHGSTALGESGRRSGKQEKNEERNDGLQLRGNRPAWSAGHESYLRRDQKDCTTNRCGWTQTEFLVHTRIGKCFKIECAGHVGE